MTNTTTTIKVNDTRKVKLQCNECGRKWSVSMNASDPQCSKCNGVDFEVLLEN